MQRSTIQRLLPRSALGTAALGTAALAWTAACAPAIVERPPRAAAPPLVSPSPPGPARFFLASPEDAFWVSHEASLDRVIAGGARLELSPEGELRAAAWELELGAHAEGLNGALALPARLGGGFVHWSRSRVFRSAELTGPLDPIASVGPAEPGIRGARPSLRGALIVADAGLRELLPGAKALAPLAEPATVDLAVADEARALRLDAFGRAFVSSDGGKSWRDLTPVAGTAVRTIGAAEQDLLLETWQGRFKVGPAGALFPSDGYARGSHDPLRTFEIARPSARSAPRDDWPWDLRDATPLSAAVFSGASLPGGSAIGVVQSVVSRVDLQSGKLLSLASDWIPSGLLCQALSDGGQGLLACAWERYQGYGGYVLRFAGGGPPVVERAFTDEGSFVADDEGALGYTGSCQATPRFFDPEGAGRFDPREAELRPVFCVRKSSPGGAGPAEWIERRVDPLPGEALLAWIPRRDGTAIALLLAGDALPEGERAAPRVSEQGGVRAVRVYRELPGWSWARPSWQPSIRGTQSNLDRRFHARADGSIDGWLAPDPDASSSLQLGLTLLPDGRPELHDLPPDTNVMIVTGDHGLAVSSSGELHQTVDHGRRWTAAGLSPIPPEAINGGGCSPLGCVIGPIVRLGWGEPALRPIVRADPFPPLEAKAGTPRLACAPTGLPVPQPVPPPSSPGGKQAIVTGYGDTLELLRDLSLPEPAAGPKGSPPPIPASAPSASPRPGKPSAPILRTHTLSFRPPFEPDAPVRRLNATDAAFVVQRRASVTPLLGADGEVDLLVAGDASELLVRGDRILPLPAFEARRGYYGDAPGGGGLVLPDGHALVLGESRRRPALEEHGGAPPLPPLFLGAERDSSRRRPMTLGRRDDGALGILIFDGASPQAAGVAELDRRAGTVLPVAALAPWSSLVSADDPRCAPDPGAYRALVMLDPTGWLDLDTSALPGIALGKQGMALVRWGKERVCLEALDVAATDGRRRGESSRTFSLVARWGARLKGAKGAKEPRGKTGAALRSADLTQGLTCSVKAPAP